MTRIAFRSSVARIPFRWIASAAESASPSSSRSASETKVSISGSEPIVITSICLSPPSLFPLGGNPKHLVLEYDVGDRNACTLDLDDFTERARGQEVDGATSVEDQGWRFVVVNVFSTTSTTANGLFLVAEADRVPGGGPNHHGSAPRNRRRFQIQGGERRCPW
jgi:hypothetical protein